MRIRLGVGTVAICPPCISAVPTFATTGKPRALKITQTNKTKKSLFHQKILYNNYQKSIF